MMMMVMMIVQVEHKSTLLWSECHLVVYCHVAADGLHRDSPCEKMF